MRHTSVVLLSCPFCGGTAQVEHDNEGSGGGGRVRVRCTQLVDGIDRCDVRTPNIHYLASHAASAEREAVRRWCLRSAPLLR